MKQRLEAKEESKAEKPEEKGRYGYSENESITDL